VAASPQQDQSETRLESFEAIARFRAREEALEVRERRLLRREQHRHEGERRQLTRQQLVRGEIEIGERRLALIGRLVLLVIAVISAVVSAVLSVFGELNPELAIAAGIASGLLGATAMRTGGGSGKALHTAGDKAEDEP
jgi:hypothetical protein